MWIFNPKLGKWYHPTGAVSENGPNDPPAEIAAAPATRPATTPEPQRQGQPTGGCTPCGHGTRQVR